jgi:ElaA protein
VVTEPELHRATGDQLDPATIYALLRLRIDVFVVEQACPWQDLDGRDLDPSTRHLWLAPAGHPADPLGCLRLLREPDGWRIGRVCVTRSARGRGLASILMRAAMDEIGGQPCVLDAQSYLSEFYALFGFEVVGDEFVEDGIPHLPMRR